MPKRKPSAAGDFPSETEAGVARGTLPYIIKEIRCLQREREGALESELMNANRLEGRIAATLGYRSDMKESERKKLHKEARQLIEDIVNNKKVVSSIQQSVIAGAEATAIFTRLTKSFEGSMEEFAKQLPVASWVEHKDQRGFGWLSLAKIIGETGDLANYATVSKVWRRMGCAPHTFNDKTQMGSTWAYNKKDTLPADEWVEFGYCRRRRAVMYVIGECLIKQNQKKTREGDSGHPRILWTGPYRARYDEVRARERTDHPEWIVCSKCDGTGNNGRAKCSNCKATGEVWLHCHRHAMLLMVKVLLKNLWIEWPK